MEAHKHSECGERARLTAGDIAKLFLLAPLYLYRWGISPILPGSCRYEPSCSSYAIEAVKIHGPLRGAWLSVKRLSRCHPWGGAGCDPVPPRADNQSDARQQRKNTLPIAPIDR